MKRFQWRLQRVLDITLVRERALQAELFALARRIVRARQEIVARLTAVRELLADLGRRGFGDRLGEQTVVLACAAAEQRLLERMRSRQRDLEAERAAKTQRFLQVRGTRRTLERLREEAREQYLREMAKLEQAQFDETAHVAFARKTTHRDAAVLV